MALLLAQRPDAYGLDNDHYGIVILPGEEQTEEEALEEVFDALCWEIGRRFAGRFLFRCVQDDELTALFMKELEAAIAATKNGGAA